MLNMTASALKSAPSWNFTPLRKKKCQIFLSICFHEVASLGEILKSAYEYQIAEEKGERIVIAGNKFVNEQREKTRGFYRPKPKMVQQHIRSLKQMRESRDNARVKRTLDHLRKIAEKPAGSGSNLMPPIVEAVKAYATVGEIMGTLREVFGLYQEVTGF